MTFNTKSGKVITIVATDETLCLTPDVTTCVLFLFDAILFGEGGLHMFSDTGSITIGSLHIEFSKPQHQFTVEWKGENVPETFVEFEKVWNRYLNLRAFW